MDGRNATRAMSDLRMVSSIRVGSHYKARQVNKVFTANGNPGIFDGRIELDTHADTFVAGRNCLAMHFTERICDVMPYSDEYAPKTGIPIVQAATGYTNASGQRSILIFNEALWMPELENSLMNPNQLRHFGIEVQDNPYHQDPMTIHKDDDEEGFIACLKSSGTNIFIDTWTPTNTDLQRYRKVVMTSPNQWNPEVVKFPGLGQDEVGEIEYRDISKVEIGSGMEPSATFGDGYLAPMQIFDVQIFNRRIMKSTVIPTIIADGPLHEDEISPPRTFISKQRHTNTTPEDLSEVWGISVDQARMTLEATTQKHVRSALMPLSRRYRMDRMYEPKRIFGEMASDTMDPRGPGLQGNRYCQVFGNKKMFC